MNNSNTPHALAGTKNIANSRNKKVSSCWLECPRGCVQCSHFYTSFCWAQSSWSKAFAPDVQVTSGCNKQKACLTLSYQSQPGSSYLLTPTWAFGKVAKFPACLYPSWNLRTESVNIRWQQAGAGHRIDYQRQGSAWVASGPSMTAVCLTDHLGSSMLPGSNKRQWWLVTNYRVTKKNSAMQSTYNHSF